MKPFYLEVIEQPITSSVVLFCTVVWVWVNQRGMGYAELGINYDKVVKDKEYWRLVVAQLTHVEILHLLFNMSALWQLGIVERVPALGSAYCFRMTVMLLVLSGLLCIGTYHVLIKWAQQERYGNVTAVGYSCVVFGWMAVLAIKQPNGIKMYNILGLRQIPMVLAPIGSLIVTSVLIPRASFVGHLCGIIAGYIVGAGAFDWMNTYWFIVLLFWIAIGVGYGFALKQKWIGGGTANDGGDVERGMVSIIDGRIVRQH
eukprot:TRINITY_DN9641_c0_g2_i1.p1 TRINITY_DN9641_c0_g2~~TRINITY_DN9641_c0_g2_i1.p1  ORF type:complete len:258 (-),score=38.89 TRINITY_DN9641_c0_g2_i1:204-977(-)